MSNVENAELKNAIENDKNLEKLKVRTTAHLLLLTFNKNGYFCPSLFLTFNK